MVPFDDSDFPNNVVITLLPFLGEIDGIEALVARPVWNTDPDVTVGITTVEWTPRLESIEIGKPNGTAEPTLSQYIYMIQGFIRHTDEVDGLKAHSWLSKRIKRVVYRNPAVAVALTALSVTDEHNITERLQRFGVRAQRFLTNEVQGAFLYMSTLELFVETETI